VTHAASGVDYLIKSSFKMNKQSVCNFQMSLIQLIILAHIPLFLPLI